MLAAWPLSANSAPYMRRSCCYAPAILEMLQADLVMLFFSYLLLDMLSFFLCKSALFSASRMGKSLPTWAAVLRACC